MSDDTVTPRPCRSLRRCRRIVLTLVLGTAGLVAGPAEGALLPPGFAETAVATGLQDPTAIALAADGRIFVAEQGGRLRVIKNGQLLPRPFATFTVNSQGERGLLGVALHPDFPHTPYVYVYYTATRPQIHNRVSRLTARGDRVKGKSEVRLLDLPPLGPTNHNGGGIHFGPEGALYIGVGENANGANAQTLANPLGKLLRIAPDGHIPPDNPFLGQTKGTARAIWALGLRNPYTFSFSPSGRLLINDVGQSAWEEIDEGAAGAHYGWPATEGPTGNPAFVTPLFAYRHDIGCAITGGTFYEPAQQQFPASYRGSYFFADLCGGWIHRLDPGAGNAVTGFVDGIGGPVDLAVGSDGSLYYVAHNEGRVVRVRFSG
ncbi:MAG TPA: PQQ-dependent sugar dehydrogenase [Thermoanaerobaculia bacterium]|nr:PQQ-dependent sugar dehydrogenase [Thermoanaerobaculia bacterium]